MRFVKFSKLFVLLTLLLNGCNQPQEKKFTSNDIAIIPQPKKLELLKGQFLISGSTKVFVSNNDNKSIADQLVKRFKTVAGFDMEISQQIEGSNTIQFVNDKNLGKEEYRLEALEDKVLITAGNTGGFLYGVETLFQLLPPEIKGNKQVDKDWILPTVKIEDGPRFKHRGLMLDLSRHFFDKTYLLNTLDRMVMHKLNVLHLHLVDDQGWRIEIKKYPLLTKKGAWRVDQENAPWNGRAENDPNEKGTYGGFLSQEDIKEIIAYGQERNIEIIPEIEMPAHVSSAIAAYPELSCFDTPIGVPSGGLWPITDIYCAGKEHTFSFLEDVLDEVMDLFPSKYIHIGGDEATKTNWKKCPHCQKRIKEEDLKDVDELQSYFVKRIEKYINSKGRTLIGWDEILEGGLAPKATVMSWRGTAGGIEAAEKGHDVIMTPESHCYFNFYQGPQDEEPLAFNAYLPLNKVYGFDPVTENMSEDEAKHVLGGQANLWSEYINTPKDSEYMLYPRLSAMAEALWSTKENRDWEDFARRLKKQFVRYDQLNINYAKSAFLVTALASADLTKKEVAIALDNEFPNSDIRYVLGNEPFADEKVIRYKEPITVSETTVLQASLYEEGQRVGKIFTDTIKFHKAFAKEITLDPLYNKSYKGVGEGTLVNVVRGSKNFHDGQWQGWLADEVEINIDLGDTQKVDGVIVGTLENQGAGIYFPTSIVVYGSENGKDFKKIDELKRDYTINGGADLLDMKLNFDETAIRYIKIKVTNLGTSPKGGGTWLFLDEIVIN